jgi:hypothetical protein
MGKSSEPHPGNTCEDLETLISLARNISGLELPPSILEDKTFEDPDPGSPPFDKIDNSAILISAHLR